ncbi:MAG: sulfotransferase [Solirubrobacteraceae bacterium]
MPDTDPSPRALRPAPVQGPLFIVGAMGSGTTLLRLMLDSHERIAIPQETGFMRAYNAQRVIPLKFGGHEWAGRMGWSREEFDALCRDFYDTIFTRYATDHGKVRWGEKTPYHTWHIDGIARLFPDAVFVAIARHPGAAVASNVRRFESNPRWGNPRWQANQYRRNNHEIIRQADRRPRRFVFVRYEDLVQEPEAVMRELLDWLGEPWSDSVLAHHAIQAARGGARVQVEGRTRVDEPVDVSRITKWTRTMDDSTRALVRQKPGRIAEFYGYDIDEPLPVRPLREGSLLMAACTRAGSSTSSPISTRAPRRRRAWPSDRTSRARSSSSPTTRSRAAAQAAAPPDRAAAMQRLLPACAAACSRCGDESSARRRIRRVSAAGSLALNATDPAAASAAGRRVIRPDCARWRAPAAACGPNSSAAATRPGL